MVKEVKSDHFIENNVKKMNNEPKTILHFGGTNNMIVVCVIQVSLLVLNYQILVA